MQTDGGTEVEHSGRPQAITELDRVVPAGQPRVVAAGRGRFSDAGPQNAFYFCVTIPVARLDSAKVVGIRDLFGFDLVARIGVQGGGGGI